LRLALSAAEKSIGLRLFRVSLPVFGRHLPPVLRKLRDKVESIDE